MLVAVFSDTHGSVEPMCEAVEVHRPDVLLHLGDCERDADELRRRCPGLDVRGVRGNCDLCASAPDKLGFTLAGVPIFMTHGHLYRVKYERDALINAAGFSGAKLALFGHTHRAEFFEWGGVSFLNPGAGGERGSFALVELIAGTAQCRILSLGGD